MRSYHLETVGSFDGLVIREHSAPEPGPYEVAVRIHASSLNYRDLAIILGQYGGPPVRKGTIPLSDGAGEIVKIGSRVTGFVLGDRVSGIFRQNWQGGHLPRRALSSDLGGSRDGVLTEIMVMHEEGVIKIASHLSYLEAAALPCAAITAWHGLHAGEPLAPGQTVLVLGSGGVSVFALQFAKHIGARVIATTSSDEKAERLKVLGASEVINYLTHPNWEHEVLRLTDGLGVDRVIETGGAGTLAKSIDAGAVNGRVVLIGVLAGGGTIDPGPIHLKRMTVQAITTGSREMFENMNRAMSQWSLHPVIDRTFGFDDAAEAYRHLFRQKHIGKVIIDHS